MPLIIAQCVITAGWMRRAYFLASPLIANCIAEACAGIVILLEVRFSQACTSSNQSLNGTGPAGSHVCGEFRFIILLFGSIFGSSCGEYRSSDGIAAPLPSRKQHGHCLYHISTVPRHSKWGQKPRVN